MILIYAKTQSTIVTKQCTMMKVDVVTITVHTLQILTFAHCPPLLSRFILL